MAIHLEHGPFRRFEGQWLLTALSDQTCKVAFDPDDEFDAALMTRAAWPVFDHIANTMADAFVERALAAPDAPA